MTPDETRRAAIKVMVAAALDAGIAELPMGITLEEWVRDVDLEPARRRDPAWSKTCLLCRQTFAPRSNFDGVCQACRADYGRRKTDARR